MLSLTLEGSGALFQDYGSSSALYSVSGDRSFKLNSLLQANSLPEAHRKVVSEHMLKKMIEKLQKNQSNPAVFEENFPLYVLLVARMHR